MSMSQKTWEKPVAKLFLQLSSIFVEPVCFTLIIMSFDFFWGTNILFSDVTKLLLIIVYVAS